MLNLAPKEMDESQQPGTSVYEAQCERSAIFVALLPGLHMLLMFAPGTGMAAFAARLGRPFAVIGKVPIAVLAAIMPGL